MRIFNWIEKLFKWLGETLSDPNDKQGSTQRLCLFLFLGTLMTLIVLATVKSNPTKLPDIPDSILNLVYFTVAALVGGIAFAKGAAVYRAVKSPSTGGINDLTTAAPEVTAEQVEPAAEQQP